MSTNSPSRVRRYGRASALGLLTFCVLVSAVTTVTPAAATTAPVTAAAPVSAPLVAADEFVKQIPVTLTHSRLRASRPVVAEGAAVTLRGMVTPAGGHLVRLQIRAHGVWKVIGVKPLSRRGTVSFTVTPTITRYYRLRFPGRPHLAPSVSSPTRIAVTPAPRAATTTTTSGSVPTLSVANVSGARARVLAIAASLAGRPYSYGAAGPGAFDCSGFTQYVFRKVGVSLPHQANAQKGRGVAVSRAQARPGDLIIFLDGGYGYHVGIYAGGSYMYDSPRPGLTVGKHQIWTWNVVFRRLL